MKHLAMMLLSVGLIGCSGADGDRGGIADELRYVRNGGGQLEFTVRRTGDVFTAHISKQSFKDADIDLPIQRPENRRTLEAVFDGKINRNGKLARESPGRETGTWVSTEIRRGTNWWKISNPELVSDLGVVETEIRRQIERSKP